MWFINLWCRRVIWDCNFISQILLISWYFVASCSCLTTIQNVISIRTFVVRGPRGLSQASPRVTIMTRPSCSGLRGWGPRYVHLLLFSFSLYIFFLVGTIVKLASSVDVKLEEESSYTENNLDRNLEYYLLWVNCCGVFCLPLRLWLVAMAIIIVHLYFSCQI